MLRTKTLDFRELEYRKEGEEGAVLASFLLHRYQCGDLVMPFSGLGSFKADHVSCGPSWDASEKLRPTIAGNLSPAVPL